MKTRTGILGWLISALFVMGSCATPSSNTPFTLQVVPQELKGFAIVDQRIHYLVTVTSEAKTDPVKIAATAVNAAVTIVYPEITEGKVAEVIVTPEAASVGKTVEVTVTGTRGTVTDTKKVTFEVIDGVDDRKDTARRLLTSFTDYLAAEHPELGIKSDTQWTGTMVSPQWLVVSHYLFFSEQWELHLEWHIMVAPDDWARIDLRKRGTEVKPSAAFEISSVSQDTKPKSIEIPTEVWR